jgi:hypothetical protein
LPKDINIGLYSLNNDPNLLICTYIRTDEHYDVYIKKELSINNYSFEDCHSFKFIETKNHFHGYWGVNNEFLKGIIGLDKANDVNNFIEDIKSNEINWDDKFKYLLRDPYDITSGNKGFIGNIYGFFLDIPNLALPGTVWKEYDGLYYLVMGWKIYNISIEWLRKLGYSE